MSSLPPAEAIDDHVLLQCISKFKEEVKLLVQENNDLKKRGQAHAQTSREIEQRHEADLTQMKERLQEKHKEVERLKKRLAAMSERRVNEDQRLAENISSSNRQSTVEEDYTHAFRDSTRVVVKDVIKKNSTKGAKPTKSPMMMDNLKAYRLACFVFEVSYECAVEMMKTFKDRSFLLLHTLINRPLSIAFLHYVKPDQYRDVLFPHISPPDQRSVAVVEDVLSEVMVLVKETAVKQDLEKLVQTAKDKLRSEWMRQQILPTFDDKFIDHGLANYIKYCCLFSWRIVTQVPSLKIDYRDQNFEPSKHDQNTTFLSDKRKASSEIKCYLWPTLLDCDDRVIAKGEVLLKEI